MIPWPQATAWLLLILGNGCASVAYTTPDRTAIELFEEGQDTIERLLVHFHPNMVYELFPVFRDLASGLAPEIELVVAVPRHEDRNAALALLSAAGFSAGRCRVLVCEADLSAWARDHTIALRTGGMTSLFRRLLSAADPAEHDGDSGVAPILADFLGGKVTDGIVLDGGNVVVGAGHVFLGSSVFAENPGLRRDEVRRFLRRLFGRDPVILGETSGVPHPHIDMYLSIVGKRTVLLGDPGLGAELLQSLSLAGVHGVFGVHEEVTPLRQRSLVPQYEALRVELLRLGLRVERIPILHSADETLFTWNNALIERRGATTRALVPRYGLPRFDAVARRTYERLGVRVQEVDASRLAVFGGTVRCATNVVGWRRTAEDSPR